MPRPRRRQRRRPASWAIYLVPPALGGRGRLLAARPGAAPTTFSARWAKRFRTKRDAALRASADGLARRFPGWRVCLVRLDPARPAAAATGPAPFLQGDLFPRPSEGEARP